MNHINLIQEAPSTSLVELPADIYHAAKRRIAAWNPIPPPKEEDNDNQRPRRR